MTPAPSGGGRPHAVRDPAALPGVAVASLGLIAGGGTVVAGGAVGLGTASVLLVTWALTPPVAIVALGCFLLVAVDPGPASTLAIAGGLAVALLGPVGRASTDVVGTVVGIGAVAAPLFALVGLAVLATSTPLAAATLLGLVAVAGYGLHRYHLVATGEVDAGSTVDAGPTGGTEPDSVAHREVEDSG